MFIAELVIVGVTVAGAELLLMLMVHPCKYPNENCGHCMALEGNVAW